MLDTKKNTLESAVCKSAGLRNGVFNDSDIGQATDPWTLRESVLAVQTNLLDRGV